MRFPAAIPALSLALVITALQGGAGMTGLVNTVASCDSNRFMMTGAQTASEVVDVYRAATADTSTPPIRSLSGEHTALCVPRDLAVDHRGQLHVMSKNAIATYAEGAAGDAAPLHELEQAALGIGMDRKDNLYVVTWEPTPATEDGAITVYRRGANGEQRPIRILAGKQTGLRRIRGIAVDAGGRIFATDGDRQSVSVFGPEANGDVAPEAFIGGRQTKGGSAGALAFDRRGFLYVANENVINVYTPGSSGDSPPVRSIEGLPLPGGPAFGVPTSLTVDRHDTLYVAAHGAIWVFGPEASGNVTPVRTLIVPEHHEVVVGKDGTLYVSNRYGSVSAFAPGAKDSAGPIRTIEDSQRDWRPGGLALGPGDTVYVADKKDSVVRVFSPGARGVAVPIRTLFGSGTQISDPSRITVDSHGFLYVANGPQPETRGAIRVYSPAATEASSPLRIIKGRSTHLYEPVDVAIDSRGNVYAVNRQGSITVYAPDADGDAIPIRTITGPNTLLRQPIKLAIGPGDTLHVLNAFHLWKYGTGNVSVTLYPPRASGDIEPIRYLTVTGGRKSAQMAWPSGLAVDKRGSVYVSNYQGRRAVAVYPRGAMGDVAPARFIQVGWSSTVRGHPWKEYMGALAVAIGPRDELFVAGFPQQMVFTMR